MLRYWSGKVIAKKGLKSGESFKIYDLRQASTVSEVSLQAFFKLFFVFLSINDKNHFGEFTLLTSYQNSLVKLVYCVKSWFTVSKFMRSEREV
jgi:hypothetical protein